MFAACLPQSRAKCAIAATEAFAFGAFAVRRKYDIPAHTKHSYHARIHIFTQHTSACKGENTRICTRTYVHKGTCTPTLPVSTIRPSCTHHPSLLHSPSLPPACIHAYMTTVALNPTRNQAAVLTPALWAAPHSGYKSFMGA